MRRIKTLARGLAFNRDTNTRQRVYNLVERAGDAVRRYANNIDSREDFTMQKQYSRNTYMGLSNG
jgi:hypothetical protein